ncbi:hypothetical protein [Haloarchaeobius amylolyticus]|uniref:hypothetical protein n=1 Tax=Haloarchaeobius amylolyticus TaxID=1198296 RepID=UPI00227159DF|nr:hypothetical protein [Haloarchaeobius amylolyticus]
MTRLKAVSIVLALAAATALVYGTVGYSSVSAERGVEVSVVGDEQALVGYHAADRTVTAGTTTRLVTVTDRTPVPVTVEVVRIEHGPGVEVTSVSGPGSVGAGKRGVVFGQVTCANETTADVSITVAVHGEGIDATLDGEARTFEVRCLPTPADDGVEEPDEETNESTTSDETTTDGEHRVVA